MTSRRLIDEVEIAKRLRSTMSDPTRAAVTRSKARLHEWFAQAAPVIYWEQMSSPLGQLFIAATRQGLCAVEFGRAEAEFLERLDPRARLERNSQAVAQAMAQLREYFSRSRLRFDLPIDLSPLTQFQRNVLETACRIAPGNLWTYHRVAEEMGRPKSSRPVGQALARNPVPIVIPCHRVIASDGSLGGYSGGSGLKAKRWLLQLEGASL
ncbi:MAG TPA: methylated-DNA--[protein]-cysteine S-methyltransferase [Candidatus Binatia bacterium]|jgi:O-6-methylguanine DNA methyltransferase